MLLVKCESGEYHIEVLGLSEMRGPAPVAQQMYKETEESKDARKLAAEQQKGLAVLAGIPTGKPSKRDRRRTEKLRGW